MDQPHRDIRFATTEDGVGIAFWVVGSGSPIVIANSLSLNHAEAEWSVPSLASFYIELAEQYRVVGFDPRGFGLSGDPFPEWGKKSSGAQIGMSTREMGLDISAVAAACGMDSFALMAVSSLGPVGIEYAAQHPDALSALILCEAVTKIESSHLHASVRGQLAVSQVEREFDQILPVTGWERVVPEEEIPLWAELNRKAWAQQGGPQPAIGLATMEWDAGTRLADIRAPTLVLSARSPHADSFTDARRIAAGISGSRLRAVDGKFTPYVADRNAVHQGIDGLLQR